MVIKESISISRIPESIWNYWMDVRNDVHWRNGITEAVWTSKPPYGKGSTGKHTHKDMGAMTWEVTRFKDGCSFEFIHKTGALEGSIAIFQVDQETNGSRVNVQVRMTGPLFMRVMMLFMGKMMRKGIQGDLLKLKEIMEKQDTNAERNTE